MLLAANTNFVFNLEAVGISLGILVSLTILLGLLIQFSNRVSKLEQTIQYLKQEIIEHSGLDGHKLLVDKIISNADNIYRLEKTLDLHIQDYVNRKEYVQFVLGQINEKVQHKFQRTASTVNNIQRYLERDGSFKIRDTLTDKEEE